MTPRRACRANGERDPAGRAEAVRSQDAMLRTERQTHREGVAVGVLDEAVAPSVRGPVLRRREHGVTGGARATLGLVRIDAQEADLDTEAALPRLVEARAPRLARVGAIGVQLDRRAVTLERGVVRGLVKDTKPEDLRIERSAPRHIAHDE